MRQMLRDFRALFSDDEPWFTFTFLYVIATDVVFFLHAAGVVVLPHG